MVGLVSTMTNKKKRDDDKFYHKIPDIKKELGEEKELSERQKRYSLSERGKRGEDMFRYTHELQGEQPDLHHAIDEHELRGFDDDDDE